MPWQLYYRVKELAIFFFFLFILRPHPKSTLFPYTTLFRSLLDVGSGIGVIARELAAAGLASVTLADASPAYLELARDRKSTRLNSSHVAISYAVFCLKKKKISRNYIR